MAAAKVWLTEHGITWREMTQPPRRNGWEDPSPDHPSSGVRTGCRPAPGGLGRGGASTDATSGATKGRWPGRSGPRISSADHRRLTARSLGHASSIVGTGTDAPDVDPPRASTASPSTTPPGQLHRPRASLSRPRTAFAQLADVTKAACHATVTVDRVREASPPVSGLGRPDLVSGEGPPRLGIIEAGRCGVSPGVRGLPNPLRGDAPFIARLT